MTVVSVIPEDPLILQITVNGVIVFYTHTSPTGEPWADADAALAWGREHAQKCQASLNWPPLAD